MSRFFKGLNTDFDEVLQPEGTYRYLLNGELNAKLGVVENEKGTTSITNAQIPVGYVVIGSQVLNDDSVIIFSCKDPPTSSTTNEGEIGIYDVDADTYTRLLGTADDVSFNDYNFRPDSEVEMEFRVNALNEQEIHWVDGVNVPRMLNLSNVPTAPYVGANLNLWPEVSSIPNLILTNCAEGLGSLKSGAYQFAFAYITKDGYQTNYFNVTNPIYVAPGNGQSKYDGAPVDTLTGVGIEYELEDVDINFYGLRTAVIKDAVEVFILPDLLLGDITTTTSGNIYRLYTGNETFINGTLEEVVIDKPIYNYAEAITQVDGTLYLGNVKKPLDIGYQRYANNIKVRCSTDDYEKNAAVHTHPLVGENVDGYRIYLDSNWAYMRKSWKRGEVYALYISFVLKDGIETMAYHIPGRVNDPPPGNGEYVEVTSDSGDGMWDKLGDHYDFQVHSRQLADPNSLGFWENENEFYSSSDDWNVSNVDGGGLEDPLGNIKTQNVRHHRIPEHVDMDFYDKVTGLTGNKVKALLLEVYDIKIPNELKKADGTNTGYVRDDIVAYKIHFAKKEIGNKLILDNGSMLAARVDGKHHHESEDEIWGGIAGLVPHGMPPDFTMPGSVAAVTVLEDRIYYMRPFSSLKDKLGLAGATHIKIIDEYTFIPGTWGGVSGLFPDTFGSSGINQARTAFPLEAIAYVDAGQPNVELTDLGFS
jgi:hypothetical protein